MKNLKGPSFQVVNSLQKKTNMYIFNNCIARYNNENMSVFWKHRTPKNSVWILEN